MEFAKALIVSVENAHIMRRFAAKLGVDGFLFSGEAEKAALCIADFD